MRYSTLLLGLCLAAAAAGFLSPAVAQPWVEPQWVMPRTPDGHPDLQATGTTRRSLRSSDPEVRAWF